MARCPGVWVVAVLEFPVAEFAVSGTPSLVRSSADRWVAFGTAADDAATALRGLDTSLFVGPEGDQYRQGLQQNLPPHLDTTGRAYDAVGAALRTFAAQVESAQTAMAPVAVQARTVWAQLQHADQAVAAAHAADRRHVELARLAAANRDPDTPVRVDEYRPAGPAADVAFSTAQAAWNTCRRSATDIHTQVAAAVTSCAAAIRAVAGTRFAANPHGLGALNAGFKHYVADHVKGLSQLSSVLKKVSAIAGVLSFVPVIGEIAGPIAFATAVVSLGIDASIKYSTGHGSWTSIAIDGGLISLPGVGKLARAGIKALRARRAAKAIEEADSAAPKIKSDPPSVGGPDIANANWAQLDYSETFSSKGPLANRTIDEVARDLKSGSMDVSALEVNVIVRDGHTLIVNTRSSQALIRAGIPRERWNVVDQTGDFDHERRLSAQLRRNKLTSDGFGGLA